MNNEKGFTLPELLIVVAIVAVLVAVSIPIFTNHLEKSRESTDLANMRAAKAEALSVYINGDRKDDSIAYWDPPYGQKGDFVAYYDAKQGLLRGEYGDIMPYGKGTSIIGSEVNTDAVSGYDATYDYSKQCIIRVYCNNSGFITLDWVKTGLETQYGTTFGPTWRLTEDMKKSAIRIPSNTPIGVGGDVPCIGNGSDSVPAQQNTVYQWINGWYYLCYGNKWYVWGETQGWHPR